MKKNAIVVLGGGLGPDGTISRSTRQRTEKGVQLYNQGRARYLVMSGSHPKNGTKPHKTEAQTMKEHAVNLGVLEDKIILEDDSTNTVANALHTKLEILIPRRWKAITVVTCDFHVPRAEYIFRKVLGKSYRMDFAEAPSDLTRPELHKRLDLEQKALSYVMTRVYAIEDGDHRKIRRMLIRKQL